MKEIEKSINETIVNSDLTDLSIDYAEVMTDSFLKDGILKDIPIVSTLLGIGKLGMAINDYIFLKKIMNFLTNIKHIPAQKRAKMIMKIEQSEKYQKNVGESLLLIMNRLDDFEKPKLIGKVFSSYLNEEIDYEIFLRLSTSIDRVFLPDLELFIHQYQYGGILPYDIQNQLTYCGLMSMTRTGDQRISGGNEFYYNDNGICLINILK